MSEIEVKCGNCGNTFYMNEDQNKSCPKCGKVAKGPKSNKSNDCFIATAAYGTPFAEEIQVLRNWRDKCLIKKDLGKFFVKIYYWLSPSISNVIKSNDNLRKLTRALLNPIVKYFKKSYS